MFSWCFRADKLGGSGNQLRKDILIQRMQHSRHEHGLAVDPLKIVAVHFKPLHEEVAHFNYEICEGGVLR